MHGDAKLRLYIIYILLLSHVDSESSNIEKKMCTLTYIRCCYTSYPKYILRN